MSNNSAVTSAVLRAKNTGSLTLSQREMRQFPAELQSVDSIKFPEGTRWWEFVPITKLDMAFNELDSIPDDVFANHNMHDLLSLSFAHNQLAAIPTSVLQLGLLKQMNFAHNCIQHFPKGLSQSGSCYSLVELRLSENRLAEVPLGLTNLPNLQAVYLDNNRITCIHEPFPSSLRILDLSMNQISSFECPCLVSPGYPSELCNMNLSKNKIKTFPPMGQLFKLTSLAVFQNDMDHLPADMALTMPSLDSLNCSQNRLTQVPKELPRSLTNVALDNNKISAFPAALIQLQKLVTLDVRNNDIKRVSPEFATNRKSLLRFYLDGNPIKDIPFSVIKTGAVAILEFLRKRLNENDPAICENAETATDAAKMKQVSPKLLEPVIDERTEKLVLKDCRLDGFPIQVSDGSMVKLSLIEITKAAHIRIIPKLSLSGLKSFKITGSAITTLDLGCFSGAIGVQEILIPMNKISHLEIPTSGPALKHLNILDLEDNQLELIPEQLVSIVPNLQQLMLANNSMRQIPLRFGAWTSLRTLSLAGNPIRGVPQSVILKGTEAVKRLLKDRLG